MDRKRRISPILVVLATVVSGLVVAPAPAETPAKVYTNADLPRVSDLPESQVIAEDGSKKTDALGEENVLAFGYAGYRDRNGNAAAWWQNRLSNLQEEIALAEEEFEAARIAVRYWTDNGLRGWRVYADRTAHERFAKAMLRLEGLHSRVPRLRDEARRAGALPGWLRSAEGFRRD